MSTPVTNTPVYLDYAAATPMDPQVLAAMQPYFSEKFYNPSATYWQAQQVHKDIQDARARIASQLGARPSEIVFTAGGTEANNLAIHGIMSQFPDGNLVVSSIEHESVLEPAGQYRYRQAPVSSQGIVDVDRLTEIIDDQTVLVSIMYANNEVGTLQPIRQVALALQNIRRARRTNGNNLPLYLHTDAAQAAAYLDLHVSRLGVDMLTLNGGKIYGPKQVGALFVGHNVHLRPQVMGGGQERGIRSGTENVAGVVGLATALDLVQLRRAEESKRLKQLQGEFIKLLQTKIPNVIVNGSQKHRLPNNVHITIPGQDNERLLFALDEVGILCAVGSACSASSEDPSHVLRAMGISDADARASLRFTMGKDTTAAMVRQTVDALAGLVGRA